jgi:DNA-binding CsgD family transcriptional regulator
MSIAARKNIVIVSDVIRMFRAGMSTLEIARRLGVHESVVYNARARL